jgi:hypothetical protein
MEGARQEHETRHPQVSTILKTRKHSVQFAYSIISFAVERTYQYAIVISK